MIPEFLQHKTRAGRHSSPRHRQPSIAPHAFTRQPRYLPAHRECTCCTFLSAPSPHFFFAIILSLSSLILTRPRLLFLFPVIASEKLCTRRGYSMNEHPIRSHHPEASQDQVLQFKISLQQQQPPRVLPARDGAPTSTSPSRTSSQHSTLPLSPGVEVDFPGS